MLTVTHGQIETNFYQPGRCQAAWRGMSGSLRAPTALPHERVRRKRIMAIWLLRSAHPQSIRPVTLPLSHTVTKTV